MGGMTATAEKISAAKRGIATVWGERHGQWKGDEAGYHAKHRWIARNKPRTGRCEECHREARVTHFANVSGEYKREVADWRELCVPCHLRFDGRVLSVEEKRERNRQKLRRWRAANPEKWRAQQDRKNARRRGVVPHVDVRSLSSDGVGLA